VETAVRELRGYGYKASQQRLALLTALAAEPHQTIIELRWRCPRVGLVTTPEPGTLRRTRAGATPRPLGRAALRVDRGYLTFWGANRPRPLAFDPAGLLRSTYRWVAKI
jgi:hypothetical protein